MTENDSFRFSAKVASFLTALFDRFAFESVRYCVLHSYESLPVYAPSDVDMAVASNDLKKVERIVFDVCKSLGFKVIQKLYYDIPRCYYYVVFFRDVNGSPGFVQLDLLNDDYGLGRYILKTKVLIENRRPYKNFYIPSVAVEACYLLIKRILKGRFSPDHEAKLRALFEEGGEAVTSIIARYFGGAHIGNVKKLIYGTDSSNQEDIIGTLRSSLVLRHRMLKPHLYALGMLWFARRVLERVTHPTGLIAIFISPDGGGKSTVADLLLQRLRYGFRNVRKMHWRPYLLPPPRKLLTPARWKEPEAPNYDPHSLPPKGATGSVVRFFYYFCDYLLGYFPKAFWPKIRTHLVVFERYYYDFLVDTKRFRLNIPSWLPVACLPLVPKGDILFVLTGPSRILFERKQEIPMGEIERQLVSIDGLSSRLHNVCRVSVDQPVDDEVSRIEDVIVDMLEKRLERRTGRRLHG